MERDEVVEYKEREDSDEEYDVVSCLMEEVTVRGLFVEFLHKIIKT